MHEGQLEEMVHLPDYGRIQSATARFRKRSLYIVFNSKLLILYLAQFVGAISSLCIQRHFLYAYGSRRIFNHPADSETEKISILV